MQPTIRDEKESRAEERRNQILEAATLAFGNKGYHLTTMDDIVAESGLSKGTLYIYFKSKKEILLALCDRFTGLMDEQMAHNMAGKTSFAEQFRAVAQAYVDVYCFLVEDPADSQVNTIRLTAEFWQQAVIDPEVNARFRQSYAQYSALGESLLQAAIDSGECRPVDVASLNLIISSIFDGLTWRWLLNPADVDWPRSVNTMLDLILNGLQPGPTRVQASQDPTP